MTGIMLSTGSVKRRLIVSFVAFAEEKIWKIPGRLSFLALMSSHGICQSPTWPYRGCKHQFNFRVRWPRECVEEHVEAQVRSINMLTFFFQDHSYHGEDDT